MLVPLFGLLLREIPPQRLRDSYLQVLRPIPTPYDLIELILDMLNVAKRSFRTCDYIPCPVSLTCVTRYPQFKSANFFSLSEVPSDDVKFEGTL